MLWCGLSETKNIKHLSKCLKIVRVQQTLSISSYLSCTLFQCTSLYCTAQILCFLQIEGFWQSCVEQVNRHHFPTVLFFNYGMYIFKKT